MGKKKNKNKNRDMWDLTYEEQEQMLREFDDFIAGKNNDFIINKNNDFESDLFSMVENRRGKNNYDNDEDDEPSDDFPEMFDFRKLSVSDTDEDDFDEPYDEIDMNFSKKKGINVTLVTGDTAEDAFVSHAPTREIVFEYDNSLKYTFISDGLERIGLPVDSNRLPSDLEVGSLQDISNMFVNFVTYNMMPYAMVDDVDIILDELSKRNIGYYDNRRFKIIYDESDEIYKLYIVSIESLEKFERLRPTLKEYQNLIVEANDRSRGEYNIANFYDSKYNDVKGFFDVIESDVNTVINDDRIDTRNLESNYIISLLDIFEVVKDVLVESDEDDDDEPIYDTSRKEYKDDDEEFDDLFDDDDDKDITDEDIDELIKEPEKEIPLIYTKPVQKEESKPITVDVEELKKNIESSAIPPVDKVEVSLVVEDKPKEEIPVKDTTGNDLDFDDLGSIPVIRKPKKQK